MILRGWKILVLGLVVLLGCKANDRPIRQPLTVRQDTKIPPSVSPTRTRDKFFVRAAVDEGQLRLEFSYGQEQAVPLRIYSVFLGGTRVPHERCILETSNEATTWLNGKFIWGRVPDGFHFQGCEENAPPPGDYDLITATEHGQLRKRLYILQDMSVQVKPWEEYSGLTNPEDSPGGH